MSLLDTPSLAVASIMAGQAAQNLGEQISDRYELEPATSLRVAQTAGSLGTIPADAPGTVVSNLLHTRRYSPEGAA